MWAIPIIVNTISSKFLVDVKNLSELYDEVCISASLSINGLVITNLLGLSDMHYSFIINIYQFNSTNWHMDNFLKPKALDIILIITSLFVVSYQYCKAENNLDLSNIKFEVICEDTVGVKNIVHIGYVLNYGDQFDPEFLELKVPKFDSEYAKLLYVWKNVTSTSLNIINKQKTTTHKVKWEVTIRPIKEGCILTPNAILLYKNDTLDISPVAKTIIITDSMNENAIIAEADTQKNDSEIKIPDNAIIRLVAVLDKETINLGDSVLMQIKLQSNQRFSEVRFDTPIEIDDCFYEYIETNAGEPIQTTVDGVNCYEWTISEYLLTPLRAGIIKIPKFNLNGNSIVWKDGADFFFSKFYDVPFHAQSNEIKLKVNE